MSSFASMEMLSRSAQNTFTEIDSRFKNRFNSLGIPVDNLSREEAVGEVFKLIQQFEQDQTPKLVATLNVDFLVNSLGYRFSKPRHPELFNALRQADLVTADGFPIVLLSKIAGFPLKERVTGADLTPELARVAAKKGKSVYLLGGGGDTAELAAQCLKKDYPELKIAGVSAPMVAISGEKLANWEDDDRKIVDEINASGADILFLAFGNPKQELWFSRNKHRLKVPVSIGIGGTFAFITGQVKRAPLWVQRCNLEWVYRVSQDPKRLVKRYAIGMVKFGFLTLPLLAQRAQKKVDEFHRGSDSEQSSDITFSWQVHWASREDVLKTLRLPKVVTRDYLEALVTELQLNSLSPGVSHNYMIDLSRVQALSLSANEAFCELSRMFISGRIEGLMIGMPTKLRKRLERARIMDMASSSSVSIDQMQESIMGSPRVSHTGLKTYIVGESYLNYFSGALTGQQLVESGFEACILDAARDRKCIVDLRRVSSIDTAAIATLYRLIKAETEKRILSLRFSGITPLLRQSISVVGLEQDFQFIDDGEFYEHLFARQVS